ASRHAVVEKLKAHALVLSKRPGEEQAWNSRIGLNIVRQEIVDRLVSAELLAARPRAFDCRLRRRDHEEHEDIRTEPGQQSAPILLVRLLRKAVEPETIDQQMRQLVDRAFVTHVAIKLLVDYGDFRASQRAGVFPRRAKRSVIEQILPPNIGADERKVLPVDGQPGRELLLERPHGTLA